MYTESAGTSVSPWPYWPYPSSQPSTCSSSLQRCQHYLLLVTPPQSALYMLLITPPLSALYLLLVTPHGRPMVDLPMDQIRSYLLSGFTAGDIAQFYGISQSTICRRMKEHGMM